MIIDHLFDDQRSLLQCALVCHSWTTAARYHIFRRMSVYLRWPKSVEPAIALLSKSKAISHYIRYFDIFSVNSGPLPRKAIHFIELLPTMPALQSLFISGVDWNGLSAKAEGRLESLVLPTRSVNLHRCVFPDINQILRFVGSSRSLVDLRLHDCQWPATESLHIHYKGTNIDRLGINDEHASGINEWLGSCDIRRLDIFYSLGFPGSAILPLLTRNVVHLVLSPTPWAYMVESNSKSLEIVIRT